jgi:hypothetical protein
VEEAFPPATLWEACASGDLKRVYEVCEKSESPVDLELADSVRAPWDCLSGPPLVVQVLAIAYHRLCVLARASGREAVTCFTARAALSSRFSISFSAACPLCGSALSKAA